MCMFSGHFPNWKVLLGLFCLSAYMEREGWGRTYWQPLKHAQISLSGLLKTPPQTFFLSLLPWLSCFLPVFARNLISQSYSEKKKVLCFLCKLMIGDNSEGLGVSIYRFSREIHLLALMSAA